MENTISRDAIATPAFLVYLDPLVRNCDNMLERCKAWNVTLRPHIKTHKTIEGALYQLFGSNYKSRNQMKDVKRKIVVATMGEAEVCKEEMQTDLKFFASSNEFEDIIYAVPISPNKLPRAQKLLESVPNFVILVDSEQAVNLIEQYSITHNMSKKWNVFLEIDAGYHRCGIPPSSPSSVDLAKKVASSPHIHFAGLYSHSGDAYSAKSVEHMQQLAQIERDTIINFAKTLSDNNIHTSNLTLSIGSTPSLSKAIDMKGVTEIHPGNYVFYDRFQSSIGACDVNDVACAVLASVIGHYPDRNRMLIDAGALAFSKDTGSSNGKDWGLIRGFPDLKVVSLSQEVAIIESDKPLPYDQLPIGSKVEVLPNHSCLTAANFNEFYVVDKEGTIVDCWKTAPRGW